MLDKNHDPYEKIFKKYGDSFCAAPWTTFWVFNDGNVAPCCKIALKIGNNNESSLKSLENAPELVRLRKQFLNGEKPKECSSCWEREKNGITPNQPRGYANECGKSAIEQALKNTNDDGTVNNFYPTWLDLLWTNKCNFGCVSCTPSTSTTIEKQFSKELSVLHNEEYSVNPAENNFDDAIGYILEKSETLKHLHFGGGEPFLQQKTFILLDKMLEKGLDKKIKLHFHTNGSIVSTYKGVNIVDEYLKEWGSNCSISLSHDHFGERGSYIRYGYNESKWLKNYHRFIDANIDVKLQTTLSLYNVASIDKLVKWYYDNLGSNWYNIFGLCQEPISLSMSQLRYSKDLTDKVTKSFDKAVEYIDRNHTNNRTQRTMIKELNNRKELFLNLSSDTSVFKSFYNGTLLLDKKRNTEFEKVFPELQEFYNTSRSI